MKVPIPSFDSLVDGYTKSVDNAISLAGASAKLDRGAVGPMLALAELAQEETRKSFSLLTAFALPKKHRVWKEFWKEFRSHDVKAARAFFYEWFENTRVSIVTDTGEIPDGVAAFGSMALEKSYGLYVDYDSNTDSFIAPADRVKLEHAFNRMVTVANLAHKARAVHIILTDHDPTFDLPAWGEVALRLCTTETYQQDMPAVLDAFAAKSTRHRELCDRMEEGLAMATDAMRKQINTIREQRAEDA